MKPTPRNRTSGPRKVCPFCGSLKWSLEEDQTAMWVKCGSCGARGPAISCISYLSVQDQQNRVKDRFFITEIARDK